MPAENTPTLVFLRNEADEEEGLGHAGIETYKDAPYESVARECGQNSSDARQALPVILQFDHLTIPAAAYPPLEQHQVTVEACLALARRARDEKGIDFFSRARDVLAAPDIGILRVSDFNTKGLIGPSVAGKPFHSLVKGVGVSSKESVTSGGSFGIGKNAAFAVSELQTVFYSTIYRDEISGRDDFLAQGKTILSSHADAGGESRQATGYWGLPGFNAVSDPAIVPEWLRRDQIGTSVFVIGFREETNWQHRIAASLLQNFLCAVHRGEIRFLIDDGSIDINSSTLPALFQDPRILEAASESADREEFEFAVSLYRCLTSADAVPKELDVSGLGRVSITLLLEESLPKRVQIIRNGMAITDSLENFGDKFARFPMYREFVALVEVLDPVGNALIKTLENPRHDALSAQRLFEDRKRRDATTIMKRFAHVIRETIKEQALPVPKDSVVLDELSEFFADAEPSTRPPQPGSDENPETFTYDVVEREARDRSVIGKGSTGPGGAGRRKKRSKRKRRSGSGAGQGGGAGGTGAPKTPIELDGVRNVLTPAESGWHRRLFFTPEQSGAACLMLQATGLDHPERLRIAASDLGTAGDGALYLDLTAGERVAVSVKLAEAYEGPVELSAQRLSDGEAVR
jgi:hypothetical protein